MLVHLPLAKWALMRCYENQLSSCGKDRDWGLPMVSPQTAGPWKKGCLSPCMPVQHLVLQSLNLERLLSVSGIQMYEKIAISKFPLNKKMQHFSNIISQIPARTRHRLPGTLPTHHFQKCNFQNQSPVSCTVLAKAFDQLDSVCLPKIKHQQNCT